MNDYDVQYQIMSYMPNRTIDDIERIKAFASLFYPLEKYPRFRRFLKFRRRKFNKFAKNLMDNLVNNYSRRFETEFNNYVNRIKPPRFVHEIQYKFVDGVYRYHRNVNYFAKGYVQDDHCLW